MAHSPSNPQAPLLMLFDGVCSLCCNSVRLVAANSAADRIHFAPMQAPQAKPLLRRHGLPERDFNSVAVLKDGKVLLQSDAVIALGRAMRFPWPLLSRIAGWVPKRMRDGAYDWIAHNRFRLFGRRDLCMMPAAGDRHRFHDLISAD